MGTRILFVEDDPGISGFVKAELLHEDFSVDLAENGRDAISIFEKSISSGDAFDLILLDIMLPEISGIEVLRRIRKISQIPVILLTARSETYDKVNGLDAGADDYLTKPFEIEELFARIRSVLRRSENRNLAGDNQFSESAKNSEKTPEKREISIKNLSLNLDSMTAKLDGKEIEFSKTEFLLLKYIMENAGKVLSRQNIINAVWGENYCIEENAVDVYVGYLRTKIDKVAGTQYISTVRGAGYVMKGEVK